MVPTLLDRPYILCTVFVTEETVLLLKLSSHCDLADQIELRITQLQVGFLLIGLLLFKYLVVFWVVLAP